MKIWNPGEIANKINGVTTRMLTDLAEKGIIIPVKNHYGAGSPRLYDNDNILEIMFAVSIRGMFSNNNMRQLMKILNENTRNDVVFMVLTHVNRTRINEKIHVKFINEGDKISMKDLKVGFTTFTEESPGVGPQTDVDKYVSVYVNLGGMKKFIADNF
jgi:DNA-binding transcriptional MerR regulator